jgi:hypothetical protein
MSYGPDVQTEVSYGNRGVDHDVRRRRPALFVIRYQCGRAYLDCYRENGMLNSIGSISVKTIGSPSDSYISFASFLPYGATMSSLDPFRQSDFHVEIDQSFTYFFRYVVVGYDVGSRICVCT